MRRLLLLLLAVGLALPLAACGRKSTPIQPDGAFYPFKYPYTPFPKTPEELEADRLRQAREADGEEFAPPEADRSKARRFDLDHPGATTQQQQPAK